MRPFNNLENKTHSDILKSSSNMKVQAHSSLEPPPEYNHDQTPLTNLDSLLPF